MKETITRQDPGLFDYQNRMAELSESPHGLEKLDGRIDWEMFRESLDLACEKPSKGVGGRPHYDRVMMFKVLVIQRYYNLSDEETEYQIRDRLTFQKFLGLTLSDRVPDANTIWLFREDCGKSGCVEKVFLRFEKQLEEAGLTGRTGKIIDASFVDVPRQRNNQKEKSDYRS